MTQAMLHVDSAPTRMPLVCTVISVVVWTVCMAICLAAWLFATNGSSVDVRDSQSNPSATHGSGVKKGDRYESESRVRPGYRF
ncbi:MAG TPA: hypothetical protein PK156_23370 [Polyangium sp.]|nr:hypothetical protein [Polyangium sp.]